MATLALSRLSRYKDTPAFLASGRAEFGLWTPVKEFTSTPAGSRLHTVKSHEVGFLDIIAVIYYGDGYETLWWTIAQANGIIDPEREMRAGMKLRIPPDSRKSQFVGRGSATSG